MAMPRLVKNETTEKLCLSLPESLDAWIAAQALEESCPKSFIVRRILIAAKKRDEARQPPREEREPSCLTM